jgi:hypothetical protein
MYSRSVVPNKTDSIKQRAGERRVHGQNAAPLLPKKENMKVINLTFELP